MKILENKAPVEKIIVIPHTFWRVQHQMEMKYGVEVLLMEMRQRYVEIYTPRTTLPQ